MQEKLQTLKGFRDFLPEEAQKRQFAISVLKKVFTSAGFLPLETPALEYEEVLTGKYGDEADKLMYRFVDNGGRKVALRYDQTVPLARVIAQYQDIPKPFKRYQIQPVWRAENTQKGRYREFLQCDIDTVGTSDMLADAEIIKTAIDCYKNLGFKNIKAKINNRSVLFNIIKNAEISDELTFTTIQTIDKLDKKTKEEVQEELLKKGLSKNQVSKLFENIENEKGGQEIEELFALLEKMEVSRESLEFTPSLARGLDYYTGTIFEIVDTNYTTGSLGGGGRYDNLIEKLSGVSFPAVGFAVGFDRTIDAMQELSLFKNIKEKSALVTVFSNNTLPYSLKAANILRQNSIPTEIYPDRNTKLEKQLKYADKKAIDWVVIIGDSEIENNEARVKNMKTGEEKTLPIENLQEALVD